jgi:hypothetical protein
MLMVVTGLSTFVLLTIGCIVYVLEIECHQGLHLSDCMQGEGLIWMWGASAMCIVFVVLTLCGMRIKHVTFTDREWDELL